MKPFKGFQAWLNFLRSDGLTNGLSSLLFFLKPNSCAMVKTQPKWSFLDLELGVKHRTSSVICTFVIGFVWLCSTCYENQPVFRPRATVSRIGLMDSYEYVLSRRTPPPTSWPPRPPADPPAHQLTPATRLTPLPGMKTWWMVGALGLYADLAYLLTSQFFLCKNGPFPLVFHIYRVPGVPWARITWPTAIWRRNM